MLPVVRLGLLACSTALLSGCLYAGGRTVRDVGPRITHQSIAFIEPGKTGSDALIAAFGEPNHRVCTRDGAEILRYDCDVRTTEGSYFFMLVATSSNTIERTCWWFEVRDDKVMRGWCDKCDPLTLTATTRPGSNPSPLPKFVPDPVLNAVPTATPDPQPSAVGN
jgi:hypothetical protein